MYSSQGRISIFEPINRFSYPPPEHTFFGYDVSAEIELAKKVKEVVRRYEKPETNPMLDFDEYDLITFAEQAGFGEIHLDLRIEIKPTKLVQDFDTVLCTAPNPFAPTIEEAINEALKPKEAKRFEAYLRRLVEEEKAIRNLSVSYL